MPGYVTHYIFGRDMYEKLNDPVLKNNLYKNRAVYALGHQGPDIFFLLSAGLRTARTQSGRHGAHRKYRRFLCRTFREPQYL